MITSRVGALVLVLLLLSGPVSAKPKEKTIDAFRDSQQSSPSKTAPSASPSLGSISGRVFAITKAGDLKPARIAHVYLLSATKMNSTKNGESNQDTALIVFLRKYLELMKEKEPGTNASCHIDLLNVSKSLSAALDWTKNNGATSSMYFTDTDEDGFFQIANLPPGDYGMIVRGQAGSNDAYWEQDVSLKPGEALMVKVSSVQVACLNTD
jgi:hypothetical protein